MSLTVRPGAVRGTVDAAPSKSYTHRAFLMGLLATGATFVSDPLMSADTRATLRVVEKLGARVDPRDVARIESDGLIETPDDVLDCANSGTTLRLASAITALAPGASVLTGDASLRKRPMKPLLDALAQLGVDARSTRDNGCAPVVIRGPLQGGHAHLPGDVSSQFVSALVLAGARSPQGLEITLDSPLKSRPYVDVTLEVLRAFGGDADLGDEHIRVPGRQRLRGRDYRVPGDYSTAAFPLVAGALTGEVTVRNLPKDNAQGDKAIVDILERFGAKVTRRGPDVTVAAAPLRGTSVDLSDTPDLFPVLCALAAHSEGETQLTGAAHLRFKESDRIRAMVTNLQKLGVDAQEREDGAVIRGGTVEAGSGLVTHDDHRILMALAVCALRAKGPLTIDDHESHAVSYPGFIDDFRHLGADLEVRG